MPFTYITGSGTQQDPYSIGSIEAWQELVANCTSPNGSELTDSYMCLDTDLDFNDITGFENWSTNPPANLTGPMDSCDYDNRTWVYLREFNGNNHTIRGAYIYQDTNGEWSSWLSLIQVIGNPSIIRNIKFDHCYFYINTGANYDYEDSAGVIINGGYGHNVQYNGAPGRVSNIEVKNSVFNFTGRYYYPALIAADCVDHIYIDNTNTINVGTTMFSCVYCGACASDIYLDPVINVVNNSYTQQFLTLSGVTINDGNIQSLYKYDKNSGKYAKASQPQLVSVGIQDESLSFSRLYIGGTVNIPAMSIANLYVAPFTIHDYYASLDVISECIGAITLNGQNTAVTSKLNLSGLNYYGNGSYAGLSFEDGQKPLCQMRNCYSVCEYNLSSVPATTNYAGLSVSYTEHNELEIEDSYNMDTVNLGSSFTGNGAVFAALGGSDTSDSHADNCYYVENVPAFTAPQYGTNTELTSQDFAVSSNTGSLDYTSTWELDAVKGRPVLSSIQEGVPAYVDGDLLISQAAPQPQVETYELILRQNYDNYGTVSGAGNYAEGDSVVITATPASGYAFVRWNDGNTDNPRTITMPAQDITYTAGFGYNLVVESEDTSKGTVTGGGLHCPGESENISATPASGYKFVQWNDGNTDNPRHVWADNLTFTAYFAEVEYYTLDVSANFPAMGTVTGGGSYEEGSTVTVTATAEEGYHFVQWDDENTDNPRTITMNDDVIMEAEFAADVVIPTHVLSLESNYTVMGSVSGDGEYAEDSSVEISATANDGYVFVRWQDGNTDNPRTVSMPHEDIEYTACFGYTVTGASSDDEKGSVSGSGNFVPGDNALLTASPANGYLFDKWDNNSEANPLVITVSDNITRTATFVAARTINLISADDTMGIVTLDPNNVEAAFGTVKDGAIINVYAVAKPDHRFVEWADGETANPRTITVTEDTELTAIFEAVTYYDITVNVNEAGRGVVYGGGTYADKNTVVITAQSNQGYRFIAWNDGNTSATRNVYVDDNKTFTAIFEEVFSREIDLSKYRGKLGRIKSRGSLYTTLTVIKYLQPAVNYCTEIGQFDTQTGKHFIFISVKNPATFSCKQYSLSLNHNHTSNEWFTAEPIDESDEQDPTYKLEVKSDGVSAALRLKYLTSDNNGENLDYQIILQNLGLEDENWYEGSANYVDDTDVPGVIASIPAGSATGHDHMHLANRGVHTHAEIDEHLDAPNPHSGHELISNKNVADGYAGLNAQTKLISSQIPFGNEAGTVTEGNDPRLSDDRYPTHHANSHHRGGDDPLFLMQLTGNLTQLRSHDSVDTDDDVNSIHHTLGSASTQAAPGDHLHDERYAPIAEGVTGGNQHNHDGVNTAAVDHEDLLNKGIYSHSDIDDHLEATNPHSGHEDKANKDIPNGYAGLNVRGKIKSEEIEFGTGAGSVCEGNDPRLNDARPPSAHATYHSAGSSDPITLSNLDGNLTQARSHDSADTDTSASSIHHTIGTGANQAAAGNHNHDAVYAPISMLLADNNDIGPNLRVSNTADTYVLGTVAVTTEVETGETDPVSGDPITETVTELKTRFHKLSHNDLSNIGTYDHEDIDQFINDATQYEVTARRGQANGYASLDANGRIPASQMPSSATAAVPNIADISARNALTGMTDGVQVRVLDASDDPSVESGWAIYSYVEASQSWSKIAEQESLDIIEDWSNIQNGPVATATEIDTAVTKMHDHNTDTYLDYGGNNQTSAAEIRAHIDDNAPHLGHEVLANKGAADGYAGLDSNGLVPVASIPHNISVASADTATEADHADTADVADYATAAGSATTATSATTAGSAVTADNLAEAFELTLSGDAEGTVSIDGSDDVTLNVTIPALAANNFSLMSDEDIEAIIV